MPLGGLFGGKPKGADFSQLQEILNRGARTQRQLISDAFAQTPKLTQDFAQTQGQLGQQFEEGAQARAQEFATGLQGVESPEFTQAQIGQAQEQAFRNLPAAQQAIRENLAATGGLGRGAAIRALQQPVLQASRQASDEAFRIQQAARGRDIERRERALETIFNTEQGAALQRLGIDQDTARTLLETGRSDILDRAFRLAGIEAGRTQGLLDIEQQRQAQDLALDQQRRARLGQILSGVGSIGGALVGAPGGLPGAIVGSQIGGQLGQFAGGGGAPDLSSLAALIQARRRRPSDETTVTN